MANGFQANPDNLDADMPRDQPGELLVRGPWIIQDQCLIVWSSIPGGVLLVPPSWQHRPTVCRLPGRSSPSVERNGCLTVGQP